MATDPTETVKEAYIAYTKEKGFAPTNPSHLVNFSKYHQPPFVGVKWSIAKKIISNPPQTKTDPKTKSTKTQSNPYLDSSITHKFLTPNDNETFIKQHKKVATKSTVATAYNTYKQKTGEEPNSTLQFHQFCEQNAFKITYSECAQYITYMNKSAKKSSSRVRALSESLINKNITLNPQKPQMIKFKPFQAGDPNAKPFKTVFQALAELDDIHNDEKYELIEQKNTVKFVKVADKKEMDSKLNEFLDEKMKIKNKIHVQCPDEVKTSHSYHDETYGKHVKITPISPDPVLSLRLNMNFNEWDKKQQDEFIYDLAQELEINPSQLMLVCTASGSVDNIIQICNIIKDKFPFIEKKCITMIESTNKICNKWKLKASKLKNWASNKLGFTKTKSKPQKEETTHNNTGNNNKNNVNNAPIKLDVAEKWLINQAESLRNQIIESLQDCPQEFEISGICALDNDKCLQDFIQIDGWKDAKLLFHGTRLQHLSSIYKNGFDDKFIGSATDPGWYGRGHYFSSYPQYCMMYCEANKFGQRTLFVSYVNLGKTLQVYDSQTYYGKPIKYGYQSHYVKVSGSGAAIGTGNDYTGDAYDEYVVNTGKRVLPRFCVTFTKKKNVVVWRDAKLGNAENSGIMDKLRKSNVIYGALTTKDALKVIKKKQNDNSVYVITNGADDSEGFINSVRNELNVSNPCLIFTSTYDYKHIYEKYKDVRVTVSASEVYEFVNKHIGMAEVDIDHDELKEQKMNDNQNVTLLEEYTKCGAYIGDVLPLREDIDPVSIIVCLNSAAILVGYAGDDRQTIVVPVVKKENPMNNGEIIEYDTISEILKKVLSDQVSVKIRIFVTESILCKKSDREKLIQLVFENLCNENYNIECFYSCQRSVLSLYSSRRTTGIVVLSDYHCTEIVPIYEGYVLHEDFSFKIDIGRKDIEEYLEQNKNVLKGDDEGMEVIFNPGLCGKYSVGGIGQAICKSIMMCDIDIRMDMCNNIVLSGMNTMFNGIKDRLEKEIAKLIPSSMVSKIKIIAAPERAISAWIGGSILASLSTFEGMWVTKQQYFKEGASIVHQKCT